MTNDEVRAFWQNVVPQWVLAEALFFAADRKLADAIGDGPMALGDIALRTGTDPAMLRRLLNALSAFGVFERLGQDCFGPSALSAPLRSSAPESQRAYIALGRLMIHRAWTDLDKTLETGRPGFDSHFGAPLFEHMRTNQAMAAGFAEGMEGTTRRIERALVAAAPFGSFDVVVDVGGSFGSLARLLLREHPEARAIVFDRPEIIEEAKRRWSAAPDARALEGIGGSFFESVPGGGDLYLLKQILHDWQDEDCVAILRNVHRAMSANARLAVVEMVLPDDGSPHAGWTQDLMMMVVTGGCERSASDFKRLLARGGFLVETILHTGSPLSVVNARPM